MIEGMLRALKEVGVESETQIEERVRKSGERAEGLKAEIETLRQQTSARHVSHAADQLRARGRGLAEQIGELNAAVSEVSRALDRDQRHLNEIEMLSLRFRRSASARGILSGVDFQSCPRCAQLLPQRANGECPVCGQAEQVDVGDPTEEAVVDRDIRVRAAELREILTRQKESLDRMHRERIELEATKPGFPFYKCTTNLVRPCKALDRRGF